MKTRLSPPLMNHTMVNQEQSGVFPKTTDRLRLLVRISLMSTVLMPRGVMQIGAWE